MKVKLRNPDRVVEVTGPKTVRGLLSKLGIVPEAVLVIRNSTLLTRDEPVTDDDEIEVRPVLSGGAAEAWTGSGHGRRSEGPEVGALVIASCGPATGASLTVDRLLLRYTSRIHSFWSHVRLRARTPATSDAPAHKEQT